MRKSLLIVVVTIYMAIFMIGLAPKVAHVKQMIKEHTTQTNHIIDMDK